MLSAQPKNFNDVGTFKNKTAVLTELDKYRHDSKEPVGEILQLTRKHQNLKIDEIAGILKISPRFIKAIESMDIDQLPEKVYTLGFIRSYAKYLDIDSQKLVDEFRIHFYGNKVSVFEDSKPNLVQTNLPSKRTLIFASAMFIITVISWFVYKQTYSISRIKISLDQPIAVSNRSESSSKVPIENSTDLALRQDNDPKGVNITNSPSVSPSLDAVEESYSKSDIVTHRHTDSQPPVIITPKLEPHPRKLPATNHSISPVNNQSRPIEVEKLPQPQAENMPEDDVINFEFLPRSDVVSQ